MKKLSIKKWTVNVVARLNNAIWVPKIFGIIKLNSEGKSWQIKVNLMLNFQQVFATFRAFGMKPV